MSDLTMLIKHKPRWASAMALLVLNATPALGQTGSVTQVQYQAALQQTASSMTANIDRSHECFVRTAFYSLLFQSGQGEATDRANRRLYESTADAFRLRINTLIGQGNAIPEAYSWVGPALFDHEPNAQRQAADWYRQDSAAADFDQKAQACANEVLQAAGQANSTIIRTRALMTTDPS